MRGICVRPPENQVCKAYKFASFPQPEINFVLGINPGRKFAQRFERGIIRCRCSSDPHAVFAIALEQLLHRSFMLEINALDVQLIAGAIHASILSCLTLPRLRRP